MDMGNPDGLSVVEHFASEDLPGLLASTTVGVFPSYVEGFGFAVLEKLAAGIPVVAYDAPGPREMLNGAPWRALTPPGDLNAFSDAVNSVLNAPGNRYAEMSSQARQIAHGFRWPSIAEQTLTLYKNRLDSLRP
jgi:glycosyltransferase involved in cell wall biosynthesis